MLKRIIKLIRSDVFKKQNLLFISYPKSGRTWLRIILHDLKLYPDFTHAGATYYILDDSCETIDNNLQDFKNNKIVFISRDPRDTVISYYFDMKHRFNVFDGTLEEFIYDKKYGIHATCLFNSSWLINAHSFDGFFHLRYEDMKHDTLKTIDKLFNFIGIRKNTRKINQILKNNEFSNMQKKEKEGYLAKKFPDRFSNHAKENPKSLKVRKGKVGGYKDYLDEKTINYCNKVMASYGYVIEEYNRLNIKKINQDAL